MKHTQAYILSSVGKQTEVCMKQCCNILNMAFVNQSQWRDIFLLKEESWMKVYTLHIIRSHIPKVVFTKNTFEEIISRECHVLIFTVVSQQHCVRLLAHVPVFARPAADRTDESTTWNANNISGYQPPLRTKTEPCYVSDN
jgi:hypothetical protein